MSIPEVLKKINPIVNFKDKICYKAKSYWENKVIPLISRAKDGVNIKEDVFIVLTIVLIGLAGFGLGQLSALEKSRGEVEIKKADWGLNTSASSTAVSAAAMINGENAKGLLVASKSGQKYHFPWCAGASQIAEKNKIWFSSYEEAQKAGYTPASNCPNLK
jgi:hypothetical protein